MKIWGFTPSSGAFSKWLSWRKCRICFRNFCISTSNYHRYTQFISGYMFLRMTNTVILVKKFLHIKKDFKIHDDRQFWPKKPLSVWNQLICQSQYCLKQKVLKFHVYLLQLMVSTMKNQRYIHCLPGVLKMLTMEKSKKPKLTIFVRQLLFIIDLYYSTLNNDIIHYQ